MFCYAKQKQMAAKIKIGQRRSLDEAYDLNEVF